MDPNMIVVCGGHRNSDSKAEQHVCWRRCGNWGFIAGCWHQCGTGGVFFSRFLASRWDCEGFFCSFPSLMWDLREVCAVCPRLSLVALNGRQPAHPLVSWGVLERVPSPRMASSGCPRSSGVAVGVWRAHGLARR